jgi:hypothetical protein
MGFAQGWIKGAHDRRPHHGCLRTDQHGVSRNHQDRQERCQQPGCETQEDGSEQGT